MLDIKTTITLYGSESEAINVDCSDTLNNLTGKDLWENSYVAADFNHVDITEITDEIKGPYFGFNINNAITSLPVYTEYEKTTYARFYRHKTNDIPVSKFDGLIHLLWLVMPSTTNVSYVTKNNNNIRVACSFNPHNIRMRVDYFTRFVKMGGIDYAFPFNTEPDKETIQDGIIQPTNINIQIRKDENSEWVGFDNNKIVPCAIIKLDDKYFVFDLTNILSNSFQATHMSFRYSDSDTTLYDQCVDGRILTDFDTSTKIYNQSLAIDKPADTLLTANVPYDTDIYACCTCKIKNSKIPMGCIVGYNSTYNYSNGISYAPVTYGGALELFAKYGVLMSWGETSTYKPIIKDGIVTGYTDNPSIKSEFDDYKEIIHEGLPDKPSAPEPSDDYDDDPWGKIDWGGVYLGAGNFTNLWYCTATDLNNLRRWMIGLDAEHPLPEGFNPMNQILGLMQFPIGLGGTLTEELTMRTQANVIVHSGVMINRGFGDDLYYNLGSIDIPLKMKERGVPFLDYSSTIELYVPFCGVFQLDPQTVLGADLSVEMWLSPVTGECNCIVSVGRGNNRGPVAFGSGNMAADIPVTANGYGLYAAAAKEASLKRSEIMFGGLTQGVQSLSAGANTANTLSIGEQIVGESIAGAWGAVGAAVGGASAAIGLGVALAQATHNIRALDVGMQHVKHASGTSVSGSFSGTSAWHYPFTAYVKITRPRYKIPSNYAHTQGIPLIKAQSLSKCNGFTMCVGTDLSSVSATEIEKEQIAAFLSNGVIV